MSKIFRNVQVAKDVVLSDAQTTYSCMALNIEGIAFSAPTVVFYAIGSAQVSSGTFSGALNGAMTEADLADSARRVSLDSTAIATTGAAAYSRAGKNCYTNPGQNVTFTPWVQLVLSRVTGAGTGVTVNVWAMWWEEA